MHDPTTLTITGAQGGSGTTTTCIALALLLEGVTQLVGDATDITTVAGIADDAPLSDTIAISPSYRPIDGLTIIDGGTIKHPYPHYTAQHHIHYAMLRGPSYHGLKTLQTTPTLFDGVIVLQEDSRALRQDDITATLDYPIVAVVDHDNAVHRVGDAGLLSKGKIPNSLHPLRRIKLQQRETLDG